jgi:hypothetical protein
LFCARTITLPPRIPATTIHEQTFMLLQDNPSAAVLFRAAVFSPAIQAGYEDLGRGTADRFMARLLVAAQEWI